MPDTQPVAAGACRPYAGRLSSPKPPNPRHPRPWHRESLFGEGPRKPLSDDQRRVWLARAQLERRAGRLTSLHVDIGKALLKRLGQDGRCDPAHATLAADLVCGPSTVGRALNRLRDVGLLTWEQRLVRRPWPAGGAGATRVEQTSNAYAFLLPTEPVAAPRSRPVRVRLPDRSGRADAQTLPLLIPMEPPAAAPNCGGRIDREISSLLIPIGMPMLDEAEKRRLNALQAARKEKLDAEWVAQRAERWKRWGWMA